MGLQMPNGTLFALAIQQGTGATDPLRMRAGYEQVVTEDADFSYFALTDVGGGPVKGVDNLPPEIGGRALPSGAFTNGIWGGGGVSMIARLDNRLGWPLLAAFGAVTSYEDQTIAQVIAGSGTTPGVNTHRFRFDPDDQYFIPWLTLRRMLPHTDTNERVGEVLQDGRLAAFSLNAAAASPVSVDLATLARLRQSNYVFDANPAWAAATYDDFRTFGVTACDGFVNVGGVAFKAVGINITLANQLLPPQQSLYIGSITPLDFPVLGRALQVTTTFLVENWDLYVSTFAGAAVDVYNPVGPVYGDSNAGCAVYRADLDVMLASQTYITGTEPYRIRVRSDHTGDDNVSWAVRAVQLTPNRPVVMQLIGTVQATPTTATDPIQVYLQNAQDDYALPT